MSNAAPQIAASDFETVNHRTIIERAGGPAKVTAALAVIASARSAKPVERETVKGWSRSDSIPGPYFQDFVDAQLATLEELARAAAEKRRPSTDPCD